MVHFCTCTRSHGVDDGRGMRVTIEGPVPHTLRTVWEFLRRGFWRLVKYMLFFTWHCENMKEKEGNGTSSTSLHVSICSVYIYIYIYAHLIIILLYTIYTVYRYQHDFVTATSCTRLCSRVVALREILPEHGKGSNSLFQAGLHWQKIKNHMLNDIESTGTVGCVCMLYACLHAFKNSWKLEIQISYVFWWSKQFNHINIQAAWCIPRSKKWQLQVSNQRCMELPAASISLCHRARFGMESSFGDQGTGHPWVPRS